MPRKAQTAMTTPPENSVAPQPRSRSIVSIVALCLVLVVVGFHVLMTASYDTPDAKIKNNVLAGNVAKAYIEPLFFQGYQIFAPNPQDSNRSLLVRAWVEQPDGEMVTTDWVNATDAELAAPGRRLLRKHLTVVAAERLMGAFSGLNAEQKEIVKKNFHYDYTMESMAEELRKSGASDSKVRTVLNASRYSTAYATQLAYALWGPEGAWSQGKVKAVQARAHYEYIPRWEDRNKADAETKKRWKATVFGWRAPVESRYQDREAFAETIVPWVEAVVAEQVK